MVEHGAFAATEWFHLLRLLRLLHERPLTRYNRGMKGRSRLGGRQRGRGRNRGDDGAGAVVVT